VADIVDVFLANDVKDVDVDVVDVSAAFVGVVIAGSM